MVIHQSVNYDQNVALEITPTQLYLYISLLIRLTPATLKLWEFQFPSTDQNIFMPEIPS